jgi:hypothetical protein
VSILACLTDMTRSAGSRCHNVRLYPIDLFVTVCVCMCVQQHATAEISQRSMCVCVIRNPYAYITLPAASVV